MKKYFLLLVLVLLGLFLASDIDRARQYFGLDTRPILEPVVVTEPVVVPQPVIKPNQETAPRDQPEPVVVPSEPRRSGPIRYDRTPERPWGYYDYCQRYPLRPECGGSK